MLTAWGSPVYNTYGASESKYIAVRKTGDSDMTVLVELNIVEALDAHNQPAASGQDGRVTLTNLINYTLPIIRFEPGDYVVAGQTDEDGHLTTIQDIKGRVNDALPVLLQDGSEDAIHPIVLSEFHVPGLDKIQFVSTRPDFLHVYYAAPSEMDVAIRKQFQEILDSKRATPTTFDVRRLEHIESDPKTGKFRLVRIER